MARLLLFLCISACVLSIRAGAHTFGINYGLLGDNLPPPDKVIGLLKSRNIQRVRLFDPNPDVLKALRDSNIEVVLGVRNEDLEQLANNPSFATSWVNTNVMPYVPAVKFRYVSAGNEVIPGPLAMHVLGAMQNLNTALKAASVNVPVSTAIAFLSIGASFPPSAGAFSEQAVSIMTPIVGFLAANQYPLLVNIYPCFAFFENQKDIRADYALGTSASMVVSDGAFQYNNLFDAMLDTMYAALERVGGQNVRVVVSESGWPSAGGELATIQNAQTYLNSLVGRVTSPVGTPKRPGNGTEAYMFALFNENLKPAGTEQNFGLYHPDMTEVYHVDFPIA